MHGTLDQPALDIRDLGVRYGPTVALDSVTLHVDPGEIVALVGPNGAGKSSLLHAVMGLVAHSGDVTVHTRRPGVRGVAFVPQHADVNRDFPITVAQVVADGRRSFVAPWRRLRSADHDAIDDALALVGLRDLRQRPLGTLSGGQAQRVFIARALAQQADLLLLDEPLAGVDAHTADGLVDLLYTLAQTGRAIVLSTHDLAQVRERFTRCLLLNGRLLADGHPAEILDGARLQDLLFDHA